MLVYQKFDQVLFISFISLLTYRALAQTYHPIFEAERLIENHIEYILPSYVLNSKHTLTISGWVKVVDNNLDLTPSGKCHSLFEVVTKGEFFAKSCLSSINEADAAQKQYSISEYIKDGYWQVQQSSYQAGLHTSTSISSMFTQDNWVYFYQNIELKESANIKTVLISAVANENEPFILEQTATGVQNLYVLLGVENQQQIELKVILGIRNRFSDSAQDLEYKRGVGETFTKAKYAHVRVLIAYSNNNQNAMQAMSVSSHERLQIWYTGTQETVISNSLTPKSTLQTPLATITNGYIPYTRTSFNSYEFPLAEKINSLTVNLNFNLQAGGTPGTFFAIKQNAVNPVFQVDYSCCTNNNIDLTIKYKDTTALQTKSESFPYTASPAQDPLQLIIQIQKHIDSTWLIQIEQKEKQFMSAIRSKTPLEIFTDSVNPYQMVFGYDGVTNPSSDIDLGFINVQVNSILLGDDQTSTPCQARTLKFGKLYCLSCPSGQYVLNGECEANAGECTTPLTNYPVCPACSSSNKFNSKSGCYKCQNTVTEPDEFCDSSVTQCLSTCYYPEQYYETAQNTYSCAPKIEKIEFSAENDKMYIQLSSSVYTLNSAMTCNQIFDLSSVNFGTDSQCVVENIQDHYTMITIDLKEDKTIPDKGSLSFVNSISTAECSSPMSSSNFEYEIIYKKPYVVVESNIQNRPRIIVPTANNIMDGCQENYLDLKLEHIYVDSFKEIEWTFISFPTNIPNYDAEYFNTLSQKYKTKTKFIITSLSLPPSNTYQIQVTVTNSKKLQSTLTIKFAISYTFDISFNTHNTELTPIHQVYSKLSFLNTKCTANEITIEYTDIFIGTGSESYANTLYYSQDKTVIAGKYGDLNILSITATQIRFTVKYWLNKFADLTQQTKQHSLSFKDSPSYIYLFDRNFFGDTVNKNQVQFFEVEKSYSTKDLSQQANFQISCKYDNNNPCTVSGSSTWPVINQKILVKPINMDENEKYNYQISQQDGTNIISLPISIDATSNKIGIFDFSGQSIENINPSTNLIISASFGSTCTWAWTITSHSSLNAGALGKNTDTLQISSSLMKGVVGKVDIQVKCDALQTDIYFKIRWPNPGKIEIGPLSGYNNDTYFEAITYDWNDGDAPPLNFRFGLLQLSRDPEGDVAFMEQSFNSNQDNLFYLNDWSTVPYIKTRIALDNVNINADYFYLFIVWAQNQFNNVAHTYSVVKVTQRHEIYDIIIEAEDHLNSKQNLDLTKMTQTEIDKEIQQRSNFISQIVTEGSKVQDNYQLFIDNTAILTKLIDVDKLTTQISRKQIIEYQELMLKLTLIQSNITSSTPCQQIVDLLTKIIEQQMALGEGDLTDDVKGLIDKSIQVIESSMISFAGNFGNSLDDQVIENGLMRSELKKKVQGRPIEVSVAFSGEEFLFKVPDLPQIEGPDIVANKKIWKKNPFKAQTEIQPKSQVISLSLYDKSLSREINLSNLDESQIEITFRIKKEGFNTVNITCGFYNFTLSKWDLRGCTAIEKFTEIAGSGLIEGKCNTTHLTDFSLGDLLGFTAIKPPKVEPSYGFYNFSFDRVKIAPIIFVLVILLIFGAIWGYHKDQDLLARFYFMKTQAQRVEEQKMDQSESSSQMNEEDEERVERRQKIFVPKNNQDINIKSKLSTVGRLQLNFGADVKTGKKKITSVFNRARDYQDKGFCIKFFYGLKVTHNFFSIVFRHDVLFSRARRMVLYVLRWFGLLAINAIYMNLKTSQKYSGGDYIGASILSFILIAPFYSLLAYLLKNKYLPKRINKKVARQYQNASSTKLALGIIFSTIFGLTMFIVLLVICAKANYIQNDAILTTFIVQLCLDMGLNQVVKVLITILLIVKLKEDMGNCAVKTLTLLDENLSVVFD